MVYQLWVYNLPMMYVCRTENSMLTQIRLRLMNGIWCFLAIFKASAEQFNDCQRFLYF